MNAAYAIYESVSADYVDAGFAPSRLSHGRNRRIISKKIKIWLIILTTLLVLFIVGISSYLIYKETQRAGSLDTINTTSSKIRVGTIIFVEKDLKDCDVLRKNGVKIDGKYTIYINNTAQDVYCDMTTAGGGWTVIQQRINADVEFHRPLEEYQHFFGDPAGNYWIGLENIHHMTYREGGYELYIKLVDHSSKSFYARYKGFVIDTADRNYRLSVLGYNGTAGDALSESNGDKFQASDSTCAADKGPWWYHGVGGCNPKSNLNGIYHPIPVDSKRGMYWYYLKNNYEALKSTQMMIRPSKRDSQL